MKASITIPNHLSEITLKQYQEYANIKSEDDYFLQCKMIQIFCNVDYKDVLKIKLSDAEEITQILNGMFEDKPKLVQSFKMNGKNYGFHPDLQDMTLGEYIDVDTFIGDWSNIHTAMNVLYRPIKQRTGGKYLIEDYNPDTKEQMTGMPLEAVISSVFFLFHLGMSLSLIVTNRYLVEAQEKPHQSQQGSVKSGDGLDQYTNSLKEILQDLKISLN
tara:strand:+ start:1517 stop:2164 length:648 start_codon:yes stop_codon:yes gene_type:complete